MEIAVLGIDLGKNSCSVVGLDTTGRVVLKRRLHRDGVVKLAGGLPRECHAPCIRAKACLSIYPTKAMTWKPARVVA